MMKPMKAILLVIACCLAGCESVHTDKPRGVNIAIWPSALLEPLDVKHGDTPKTRRLVSKVLADAGLHPSLDNTGVSVPDDEERRAREVLLTDARLTETDVLVVLVVPAGSGRKTQSGFEVPDVAPAGEMRVPDEKAPR